MSRLCLALVQLSVGPEPAANLPHTLAFVAEAQRAGARLVSTPECTNFIAADRAGVEAAICTEADDPTLRALRAQARAGEAWLHIGSLLLRDGDAFVNRGFVIDPQGEIRARYDKIHLFDATLPNGESYRESAQYRGGAQAVVAPGPARLGLSICYDLRFASLYRSLAKAGAQILAIPAAFTETTGAAHWHVLLRARAIETASFVIAAAQCGEHWRFGERNRRSYGHSLVVDPWGRVVAQAPDGPGVTLAEIDLGQVEQTRAALPSLEHDRIFAEPDAGVEQL